MKFRLSPKVIEPIFITLKYPNISMSKGKMPMLSVAPHFCDLLHLIAKKRYHQRQSHSEKCNNMEKNGVKTEKRNIPATGHIPRLQTKHRKAAYFRLCSSCFWCASYLLDIRGTVRCPSCKTEIIESMPISPDERFAFHHDRNRGVSLEFLTA
jgi:hypothetical protein